MKLKPILIDRQHYTDDPITIVLVDAEAEIGEGSVVYFGTYVIEILRISIPNDSVTFMNPANDKLLTLPGIKRFKIAIASTTTSHNLSLLSAKATSDLIDYYNKNKCLPEFVEWNRYTIREQHSDIHGTIDITIPEEEKLYTESEVRETSIKFFYHWYNSPGNNTEQGFDKWFNEHKK